MNASTRLRLPLKGALRYAAPLEPTGWVLVLQATIQNALIAALRSVGNEFKANRLAYLSLTAKNEVLLCGAVSRQLHEHFADRRDVQIRREWWCGANNAYFDIAILRCGEPLALIEAKAAMSFDLATNGKRLYPSKDVLRDIGRLRNVDFDGGRYVMTFFTHHYQVPGREHDSALPYVDGLRRHGVIDRASINDGFHRLHEKLEGPPVLDRGEIAAGTAFGVEVSVLYWLMAA